MKLIIVESPHKAKTIAKFLKGEYKVEASKGHIRDLPVNYMGVNIKENFEPYYVIAPEKKADIKRLTEQAKKAEIVYLATDPDREGEAISWHLAEVLNLDGNLKNRIEFNEISEKAVKRALENPRKIDMNLVDAQQARRVLDRIVGYSISPSASTKLNETLSAGRVQSVALKMVVDREREILAFVPQEYWLVKAEVSKNSGESFKVLLSDKNGKKYKPQNEEQAKKTEQDLANATYKVKTIKRSVIKSHAPAPFITSTLQQDGSIKLNVTAPQIMQIAQRLYEGVETPRGNIALITYMRTDSVRVSAEAQNSALQLIRKQYGDKYAPTKPNFYKSKNSAQDAHEAIRPIDVNVTPESVEDILDKNQYKLYKLIYDRFIASQMSEALYDSVAVEVQADEYLLKTSGKTLTFKGYTAVYDDTKKEDDESESGNALLPPLTEGEILNLKKVIKEQKFTKPPIRYTEATLIKNMEDKGIGRPSTYATIMAKLSDKKREYVRKEKKHLVPNPISYDLIDFLVKFFPNIMDVSFTAKMEDELDTVGSSGKDWRKLIADFYGPFEKQLLQSKLTTEKCSLCGEYMYINSGKYGNYYSCSNPNCKQNRPVQAKFAVPTEKVCPKCGGVMLEREGKFGKFLACSNYPKCKYTEDMTESVGTCPECGMPTKKKMSKGGKVFYGCSNFPKCKFMSWDIPTGEKCPDCGEYLIQVDGKIKCSKKGCKYTENANS